jgi:hypothetical protein
MSTLDDTVAVFQKWLDLPYPAALYATLGTVAANRLEGDPVWLLLVGAPSSGKSEILQATGSLEGVHPTASLTEAGLLSGSPKREKAKHATGGLLRKVGDHGIVLAKDFGSVLSLHHDARAQVLAALREVYDGKLDPERRNRWRPDAALARQVRTDRRLHADHRPSPRGDGRNGRAVRAAAASEGQRAGPGASSADPSKPISRDAQGAC